MYLPAALSFHKGRTTVSPKFSLYLWGLPIYQDPPPHSPLPERSSDVVAHISPLAMASILVFQVTRWTTGLRMLMKILSKTSCPLPGYGQDKNQLRFISMEQVWHVLGQLIFDE